MTALPERIRHTTDRWKQMVQTMRRTAHQFKRLTNVDRLPDADRVDDVRQHRFAAV